jgi:hypothetical protein
LNVDKHINIKNIQAVEGLRYNDISTTLEHEKGIRSYLTKQDREQSRKLNKKLHILFLSISVLLKISLGKNGLRNVTRE